MVILYLLMIVIFLYFVYPYIRIYLGKQKIKRQINKSEFNGEKIFENIVIDDIPIDMLIISSYGVFVIGIKEIKRTFCILKGDEKNKTWTQHIPNRFRIGMPYRDKKFKNPLKDISLAKEKIKNGLKNDFPKLNYYSILILVPKVKVNNIKMRDQSNSKIINANDLLNSIKSNEKIFTNNEVKMVLNKITSNYK